MAGFSDDLDSFSAWADYNAGGSAVWSIVDGKAQVYVPGASGLHFRAKERNTGATPWEETVKLVGTVSANYAGYGVGIRDSVGGKLIGFWVQYDTGIKLYLDTFTDPDWANATPVVFAALTPPQFLRVKDDGTDLTFSWSVDGVTWTGDVLGGVWYTQASTAFLDNPADKFLLVGWTNSADMHALFEWVRAGADTSDAAFATGGGVVRIFSQEV